MRAVKSSDTGPEMAVRKLIHGMGFRYKLHQKKLPGKPDLVFPRLHKVIFVNGCFWHGHNCLRGARLPKANRKYWKRKIARNKQRDRKNLQILPRQGWTALTIWECETRKPKLLEKKLSKFLERLAN